MRLTEYYFARPLFKLTSEDNEIDGGGVESIKTKVWNVTTIYAFSIFPSYSLAIFSVGACTFAHPLAGLCAAVYVGIDLFFGYKQNSFVNQKMIPVVTQFQLWERRIREWWNATPLIKQNGIERRIINQVKEQIQPALKADHRVWYEIFPWIVLGRRITSLLFALGLYLATGYLVFQRELPLASFILILFSFEQLRNVLEEVNDHHRELGRLFPSIDKYRQVLVSPIPFHYSEGEKFTDQSIGISCKGVTLALGEGGERRPILRDVNFVINPGERIGIVGPSGAGKSQLINLILRGMDPDKGEVYINDIDLRKLSLESYLRFCGIIPQKSDLFEDSIKGNVMFGVSDYDWQEVSSQLNLEQHILTALGKAGLNLSDRLGNGVETMVGYKGMRLSGGQQARMRIADAHFKLASHLCRPRLVIADEPTAALDSLSELAVMTHLTDSLPTGTTVLMIAHRLSTVAGMDRIMFVRPLEQIKGGEPQVTLHDSLSDLYQAEALFREIADAQNFRP
jgi:ABC-type multidrug transport system fused ATPase/permease subunit